MACGAICQDSAIQHRLHFGVVSVGIVVLGSDNIYGRGDYIYGRG